MSIMNEFIVKQKSLLHSIARSKKNFEDIGEANITSAKIRSRMSVLKETWSQCIEMHTTLQKVVAEDKREDLDYFKTNQFDEHEAIYLQILDLMADCLEKTDPKTTSSQPATVSSSLSLSHLPPIQIPPFSGNYDEWETFRDRFTSLIRKNKDLTAFTRMHFLSSVLTGRALDAIKNIPVTGANFDAAWKTLVSRYENKRRLIAEHVSALYNLPQVSRESAVELNELRDKATRAVTSLKNLNRSPEDMLNDILVYGVSQKLDHATRKAWKLKGSDESIIPTFAELEKFIAARARALEELYPTSSTKNSRPQKVTSATASTASALSCPLCKAAHFINKCPKFIKKSPSQRLEIIQQAKRCVNCLSTKHTVSSCQSKYSCRTCQKQHHSMLHADSNSSNTEKPSTAVSEAPSSSQISPSVTALNAISKLPSRPHVLLATARVKISSIEGRSTIIRALLDQGSELTFITERLRQILNLRRLKVPVSISAVGCVDAGNCRYAAFIKLSPVNKSHPVLTTTASILNSLTSYSPSSMISHVNWPHLTGLNLADPDPLSNDPIDIIIGADLYSEVLLDGIKKGSSGQPIAQQTILGWVLSGPTSIPTREHRTLTVQHCSSTLSLDQALCKFWELEEIPSNTPLSPDEQQCEEHFLATHSRRSDGRYVVNLPFKNGPPIDIGESRQIAERCLKALHRKFQINPELKTEYASFMTEYEALGHMQKAANANSSSQCVYIPHHPVIRETSITTHLRVVFNASSKTSNATSLNDHLLVGPKLQADLPSIILRWRQYRYVYSADITKMYRQIFVNESEINYQRILWTENSTGPAQEYQLQTITYGTASAPFLALRVIQQLVVDEGESFPLAAQILQNNTYVDDVLFGADDIPLLRQTRDQVRALLQRGGFELRKWSSNSAKLLTDIVADNHGLACNKNLQSDEQLKILGVSWNPSLDVFQFRVSLPLAASDTKRSILSVIAKLFDPLGWSTPVTISAKIFMQQLWQVKLDWDDKLPSSLSEQWDSIKSSLAGIDSLKIDRWIQRGEDSIQCELHGFSDASNAAYAAAVYIRLTSLSGQISSMLLTGKAKVAPVKPLTIPRLELSAAVLLARLIEFVRTSLNLANAQCHCWTDSNVVLAWVTQHPSKWKTFVSNRVADIQSRIPLASWRHVSTRENPADCASRGIPGRQLASHNLWWQGPAWLRLPESEWPSAADQSFCETSLEKVTHASTHHAESIEPWDLATRYLSWPKLLRITAYILRYTSRIRNSNKFHTKINESLSALSSDEFQRARIFWLSRIQDELFAPEKKALSQQRPISSKSAILSLNPFLDDNKLIRVGGRLSNAPFSNQRKHPIVLASHSLVDLIIRHAHLRSMHAGTQLTLATVRQEFWVIRARSIVKNIIHKCVICVRERAAVPTQLMGNLPRFRVSPPSRAFLHCGVDYAGPVFIRSMSGRGIASRKAYIAVFVCMASRAIHLELVEGYHTPAFIAAYSRFCARRGLPQSMYSDNGTTFVGADRELTAAFRASLRDPNFLNRTAADQVSWHFIPPSAPHFGGLWEAGVRSMKHHLNRVTGDQKMTFEEFSTLLCNIEACLNSRPLAPLHDALDDYEPLTPGHFLIGSALKAIPEPSVLDIKENRLSRWQMIRQLTERFWKLWLNDYVNTLQQRVKWKKIVKDSLRIGQLVLIRNSLLPSCKWELGRIVQCHAGTDNLIRVVTVKTASSEYKRPIGKLCLLPIDIENDGNSR